VSSDNVLPGYAIAHALRLRCSGEELLVLSLGLGLFASNLSFVAVSYARATPLYWLLPFGAALYLALQWRSLQNVHVIRLSRSGAVISR
jgi:hypothetical protein